MGGPGTPLLSTFCLLLAGCASAPASPPAGEVRIVNLYQTWAEALPTERKGCEFRGRISVILPELQGSGTSFYDPEATCVTLRLRAARMGANTAIVSLPRGGLQLGERSVRATTFWCQED